MVIVLPLVYLIMRCKKPSAVIILEGICSCHCLWRLHVFWALTHDASIQVNIVHTVLHISGQLYKESQGLAGVGGGGAQDLVVYPSLTLN